MWIPRDLVEHQLYAQTIPFVSGYVHVEAPSDPGSAASTASFATEGASSADASDREPHGFNETAIRGENHTRQKTSRQVTTAYFFRFQYLELSSWRACDPPAWLTFYAWRYPTMTPCQLPNPQIPDFVTSNTKMLIHFVDALRLLQHEDYQMHCRSHQMWQQALDREQASMYAFFHKTCRFWFQIKQMQFTQSHRHLFQTSFQVYNSLCESVLVVFSKWNVHVLVFLCVCLSIGFCVLCRISGRRSHIRKHRACRNDRQANVLRR